MTTQSQKRTNANPMANHWTKAGQVRRAFKAGPKRRKDRALSTTDAIFESGLLLHKLRTSMIAATLSPNDVQAGLVLMDAEGDTVHVIPVPDNKQFSTLFSKVDGISRGEKVLPLGVVFFQKDRQAPPSEDGIVWAEPFLVGPRAEIALRAAKAVFANGIGGKAKFN